MNPVAREGQNETPPGVDALEFGARGENVEVVKAILMHERSQGKVVVTAKALAAGAGSGSEGILRFLLQKGGYPDDPDDLIASEPGPEATWRGDRLSSLQKQAIKDVVPRDATSGSCSLIRLLLSYLTERWPLEPGSREAISTGILSAPRTGHADNVELLLDLGFNVANQDAVSPPCLDVSIVPSRTEIINDSLVKTAEGGALSTIKPLLENLIKDYNADIHASNGRCANGITALWVAVLNQHVETVEVFLELGAPVESFEVDAKEGTEEVWLAAHKEYGAPVRVKARREEGGNTSWMRLDYAEGRAVARKWAIEERR